MSLCLVIPSYRDSARLAKYLPELCASLESVPGVSILVVDDGSGPEEAEKTRLEVSRLRAKHPILLAPLLLEPNRGKGGAIYAGWDAAPPIEWLAFADADGATPAGEVARLVRLALEDTAPSDVYLASRVKMLGRTVSRSFKRHVAGRVFATLSSWMTGLAIYDSQCGCKIVRRSYYERVRDLLVETRFAFDIELLTHLHGAGAAMREVPVDWCDIPGSKVSLLKDGMQMLSALWKLQARKPLERRFEK
jgi:glycosyltransferase involved in cell wall biosynthesis